MKNSFEEADNKIGIYSIPTNRDERLSVHLSNCRQTDGHNKKCNDNLNMFECQDQNCCVKSLKYFNIRLLFYCCFLFLEITKKMFVVLAMTLVLPRVVYLLPNYILMNSMK